MPYLLFVKKHQNLQFLRVKLNLAKNMNGKDSFHLKVFLLFSENNFIYAV